MFFWKWWWGQISIKLALLSAANYNSRYNLLLCETFYCLIETRAKDNISATQHKLQWLVLQYKVMWYIQYNTGSKQILLNLPKWYILMWSEWQTIHSTLSTYPQHIIITSTVYWQALLMHHLQITVSKREYPNNKRMSATYFAACWARTRTKSTGVRNLTRAPLNWLLSYHQYLFIFIDNVISDQPSGPILQPFTQKLWQGYISMTSGNSSSN